jgi:hypothetical protein
MSAASTAEDVASDLTTGSKQGFDYATLIPDLANIARDAANRIKGRVRASILDTGRDLIAVKAGMKHGQFGVWLRAEFAMTERTAENYMNGARWLDGKSEMLSLLPPAAVYVLAAPSAPAAVVNEVVASAEAGTVLPLLKIKEKLAAAVVEQREVQRVVREKPGRTEDVAKKIIHRRRGDAARYRARLAEETAREDEARKAREAAMQEKVDQLVANHPQVMVSIGALLVGWQDIAHFQGALRKALTQAQHPGAVRS